MAYFVVVEYVFPVFCNCMGWMMIISRALATLQQTWCEKKSCSIKIKEIAHRIHRVNICI